ncbi:hypothetical protein BC936DRAFT_142637 [Jimgerdemannia flammicorona]|uniref:Uncharacterized protein n=1 Tax=Jimgerdemannia flammicorona TaxID=994334 RepID=A0A433A0D7_9FUNG|nr:hypothetical protein BC936DRAFT_142637 [Jimgerdemannia flammicorona]
MIPTLSVSHSTPLAHVHQHPIPNLPGQTRHSLPTARPNGPRLHSSPTARPTGPELRPSHAASSTGRPVPSRAPTASPEASSTRWPVPRRAPAGLHSFHAASPFSPPAARTARWPVPPELPSSSPATPAELPSSPAAPAAPAELRSSPAAPAELPCFPAAPARLPSSPAGLRLPYPSSAARLQLPSTLRSHGKHRPRLPRRRLSHSPEGLRHSRHHPRCRVLPHRRTLLPRDVEEQVRQVRQGVRVREATSWAGAIFDRWSFEKDNGSYFRYLHIICLYYLHLRYLEIFVIYEADLQTIMKKI